MDMSQYLDLFLEESLENVQMDFDQIERISEVYGDSVLVSEHSKEGSVSNVGVSPTKSK